jgi:hypothetical protein
MIQRLQEHNMLKLEVVMGRYGRKRKNDVGFMNGEFDVWWRLHYRKQLECS